MVSLDELLRILSGKGRPSHGQANVPGHPMPPLIPEARDAASVGARAALSPKQSDESHLIIRPFGPDGGVLQRSEEWTHGGAGLKAVTNEIRVPTCTGELVEPKQIRVVCLVCGGHDSVVTHCRCGVALCRRCLRRDPGDNSPLCPPCYEGAVENFDTWAAQDQQRTKEDSR